MTQTIDEEAPDVLLDLLFMAHSKGETRMVQRILEAVWEKETKGFNGGENIETPEVVRGRKIINNLGLIDLLCQASSKGKKSLVQQILKFYDSIIGESDHVCIPLVKQVDRIRKKTALMYACETGYAQIVQILLDSQASVDVQDYAGWTALMLACHGGYTSIVSKLLDCKAVANIEDSEGMTAFMIACKQGHLDIVQLLLEQDVDLLTPCTIKTQKTALMYASENGHGPIVRALLSHHQNGLGTSDIVNRIDVDGWTSLMMASLHDHVQVFRLLCEYGANMNAISKRGQTAFNVAGPGIRNFLQIRSKFPQACKSKDEKVIETLLIDLSSLLLPPWNLSVDDFVNDDDDDEIKAVNNDWDSAFGKTPLILACEYGLSTNIVDKLIQLGAGINRVDSKGRSPLMYASYMGYDNIVQLLIERNADVSVTDNDGKACIQWAEENNHFHTATLLPPIAATETSTKTSENNNQTLHKKLPERFACSSFCAVM